MLLSVLGSIKGGILGHVLQQTKAIIETKASKIDFGSKHDDKGKFDKPKIEIGTSKDDKLVGGEKSDKIFGGKGDDALYGKGGNDKLFGGAGDDYIDGGKGFDLIHGGKGNDYLIGGAGKDMFVFGRNDGHDTIADFEIGKDVIKFVGLHHIDSLSDLNPIQDGDSVLLQIDPNNSIRLMDTDLSQLGDKDFWF